MTDFVRSTYWLHSPTWIGFWLFIGIEVQSMLFVKHFMFFPPGACCLHYVKPSSHGGYYYMQGDGFAVPLHPSGILN